MQKIGYIIRRELKSFFVSPSAYMLCVVFLVLTAIFFRGNVTSFIEVRNQPLPWPELAALRTLDKMVIQPFFGQMSLLYLLLPILTMRLLAEEKKLHTIELLFTSPLSIGQIVIGKYLASVILLAITLIMTLPGPVLTLLYGNPNPGILLTGYLGLFFVGLSFLALGLFASSLTDNQIIAAILGFGLLVLFWIIGGAPHVVGVGLGMVLAHLSILEHFYVFTKGLVELKDVVFFLSFIFFFLFLTYQVLESNRWR
ncbi:MAG: ABC transporter permease [Pseudomonadota bacterium]